MHNVYGTLNYFGNFKKNIYDYFICKTIPSKAYYSL